MISPMFFQGIQLFYRMKSILCYEEGDMFHMYKMDLKFSKVVMPPTLKKLKRHIDWCVCVRPCVRPF